MDIVVALYANTVKLSNVPCGGPGGQLKKVGVVDNVGNIQSISMRCDADETHDEYIVIQHGHRILGVVPNTPMGKRVVNQLREPCILHVLSIG